MMRPDALAPYRRHRQECEGGHPQNSRTSEFEERKKGWRRCECPIFASGTLRKKFKRHNTGQWEFEAARATAAAMEQKGSWKPVVEPAGGRGSRPVVARVAGQQFQVGAGL